MKENFKTLHNAAIIIIIKKFCYTILICQLQKSYSFTFLYKREVFQSVIIFFWSVVDPEARHLISFFLK